MLLISIPPERPTPTQRQILTTGSPLLSVTLALPLPPPVYAVYVSAEITSVPSSYVVAEETSQPGMLLAPPLVGSESSVYLDTSSVLLPTSE